MSSGFKTFLLWAVLILGLFLVIKATQNYQASVSDIAFSEFEKALNAKTIQSVTIIGDQIEGERMVDGKKSKFSTRGPTADSAFVEKLKDSGVEVYKFMPPQDDNLWSLFIAWGPMIAIFIFFLFIMRNIQMGGGKAMSFGKSRARLMREEDKGKVTFKDVAGIPEAKEELQEIVEFLKDPKKFQKLGGRIPKGVLLMGAPGTGKTLIAKAIAGEANVPFFSISGSDFVEMFVGVGASRVRDLFLQARKAAPCLLFIDEIDAVGRHRGAGLGGGHDEREQTLNQLLVEMDGFEGKEGIIILAATNRPDVLDPALLRAGRFDRRVVVPKPEVKGREEILKVHANKLKVSPNVDLAVIARGTPGFVGADLENICNEAALLAARSNKDKVEMTDFEKAKDKVMMGAERRSLVLNEMEKKTTAVHEAGHTMVAKLLPGTDPVHKVTIIPRGMALGLTMQLPEEDRHSMTSQSALDMITILLGGRAAEELIFPDITTGAGNDIERATEIARKMVTEWGMSAKIGPVALSKKEEHVFLGKDIGTGREFSEQTAVEIDSEIRRILTENYARAKTLLKTNIDKLKRVSDALLERETLDGPEIDTLIAGGKLAPLESLTGGSLDPIPSPA
ncbi:MAG: ATP-dependent zinc metalloprotease FtsH [Deltaproteobacteria bacterium]|nr:ATP-dependent zinc metalloprotease FtsH [Deltaproteobacteria bacterium]